MKYFRYQIILFVVLGFLAGISGGLLIFNFVLGRELSINRTSSVAQNSTTDSSNATARLGRELNQIIVEFYKKKSGVSSVTANVLLDSEFLGYGSVLTSDGWVLTHQNVFNSVSLENAVMVHNGRVVAWNRKVRDKATGLWFIKTDIKNVPSVKLSNAAVFPPGETVLVGGARGNFQATELFDGKKELLLKERDVIHKSEDLYHLMAIDGTAATISVGAPIMTDRGELIGVVARNRPEVAVVPTQYILYAKDMVFKDQKIIRPYFGVTYIQLPKNFISDPVNLSKIGVFVVAELRLGAYGVAPKSPAFLAGIKTGDILTALNDEEINSAHSLSELLLQYKKGDTVEVKLLRAGQELAVKVELDSWLASF